MAFVYINGYPGIGKLTVANELTHVRPSVLAAIFVRLTLVRKIVPSSEVIGNHSLIDPVARKYERWMPEYYPMRKAVVRKAPLKTPFLIVCPLKY